MAESSQIGAELISAINLAGEQLAAFRTADENARRLGHPCDYRTFALSLAAQVSRLISVIRAIADVIGATS